jgi:hypothetical protein
MPLLDHLASAFFRTPFLPHNSGEVQGRISERHTVLTNGVSYVWDSHSTVLIDGVNIPLEHSPQL